ncbi:MAG TPA: energy transducer TonB [Candidatus Acidoferrum sp.]
MFSLAPLVLALLAGLALHHQQPTCDLAAPPPGMHYVCANPNSCDCQLVADNPSGDESQNASPIPVPHASSCAADKVKYFVAPDYPRRALQAAKQGTVIATLAINPAGDVDEVKIHSGDPLLDGSVIETLKKWKFLTSGAAQTVDVSVTFALAGDTVTKPATTVSGSSPLNLVITAGPLMSRRAGNHRRAGSPR